MHDATEGGFIAALNELAEASKLGFEVESDKIADTAKKREFCKKRLGFLMSRFWQCLPRAQ